MTEPKRLAETTGSPLARALLRSVEQDEAPANTANHVALVLGVALPATLAAATTQAAAATAGSGLFAGFGAVKLTIIAVMLSSSFGVGVWAADRKISALEAEGRQPGVTRPRELRVARDSESIAPPKLERTVAAPPVEQAHTNEATNAQPPRSIQASAEHFTASPAVVQVPRADSAVPNAAFAADEPTPPTPLTPDTGATSPAPPKAGTTTSNELERELSLLDAASQALKRGEAREALTLLDRHRTEIRRKSLTPESLVLRVQTLLALGNRAAAAAVATKVLEVGPDSKHAQVVRALLEEPLTNR